MNAHGGNEHPGREQGRSGQGQSGQGQLGRGQLGQCRLTAVVDGMVQGVGFRWWTKEQAARLGLTGTATNRADGTVAVVAEGPRQSCEDLLALLRSGRTPGRVQDVRSDLGEATGQYTEFAAR